jgi:hypothetical protein
VQSTLAASEIGARRFALSRNKATHDAATCFFFLF